MHSPFNWLTGAGAMLGALHANKVNRELDVDEHRRSPFGNTLRRLREAAAISQEELAERAGLSLRGVSDLERGVRTTPRLETVRMLADGLGLDTIARQELLNARNIILSSTIAPTAPLLPGLPVPATSFIGRDRDIAEIERSLMQDHVRLLTLLGPGGVGKTRVAIQSAHRLADAFAGGAVFVDLSSIRNKELVLPTIAAHLGVTEQPGRDVKESLLVALQNRHLLLVLDNLEQVIDGATDVAWLQASFRELVIIVTSRVRLRVAAEQVQPVEPLPLPIANDVDALQRVDAVSLFLARARAIDPGFTLGGDNASVVADIVTMLQGMPLAIELASARIRMLSLTDLLDRLEAQLSVLGGGARDAPGRQRTMRDTISWSYELLSPTGQTVYRTLAIFPDGCTLQTAAAVLGVANRLSEAETLDAMESLVDGSMLRPRVGPEGEVWYRMLQTLQDFGLEQLTTTGEETMARRSAHDAWAVPLARRVEWALYLPDIVASLNRMEAEHQNVRSHISWLVNNDYLADALDISASLTFFRTIRGHFGEGRRELEILLAHSDNQAPTVTRMRGLIGLGVICNNQARSVQSVRAFEDGIGLARELGEQRKLAWALIGLGTSMGQKGELDEAEALTRESISLGEAMGDKQIIAAGTTNLGVIFDQRGDLDRAYEFMEQGLALSLAIDNTWGLAIGKLNLSSISIRRGELDQAEQLVLEAQRLFGDLGDKRDLPAVYLGLADVARLRGDVATAERWLEQSLGMARETGSMLDIANSYLALAQTARLKNDFIISQTYTCTAIQWYERIGNTVDACKCLDGLAETGVATGDLQRAAWCLGAVDGVLQEQGMLRTELVTGEHQARVNSVKSVLSDGDWQSNYDRAFAMSEDDILIEVKLWLACDGIDGMDPSAFSQHTKTNYEVDTR